MKDPKTPAQLESEIRYFTNVERTTTSRDRQRRAHRAIVLRQTELALAERVRKPGKRP